LILSGWEEEGRAPRWLSASESRVSEVT